MTAPLDPRLDDFERRLHELEDELTELRLALAAVDAEAAVEPPGESDVPAWAQQWMNLGTFAIGSPPYNAALQAITE